VLGAPSTPLPAHGVSLRQAGDDWLRRLETQQKSESTLVGYRVAIDDWLRRLETQQKSASTLVGYRVAIDDLLDWSEKNGRDVLTETAIVDYLHSYQERAQPAEASYYRRFVLLREFVRWVCRRDGVPDPFLDLDAPPKPHQERDWLTPEEFRRLLDSAGRPERNLPGLAERDRLVLLALVTTGLRRSELCALEWRDLELGGREPSLLVRCGKGSKSRRQPLPTSLARELRRLRAAREPEPTDPVFCGLEGGRLQETILVDIIRRTAKRAGIEKHVTAHTLCHTAATWLRQELRDTRLVAEYLGYADLSTVGATPTSTARSCSKRRVDWRNSPVSGMNPDARPAPSRLPTPLNRNSPRRPAEPRAIPLREVIVVVVMGGTAVDTTETPRLR
jgi:integrase/recombinase XerC